ncbi:hypothetical protein [Mycolicibacterium sp. 624]|uniref:hypothetical protein n=1 Tax=Mycolicibacterium sp. 624 TaxID=3156314 RepID=UPI0033997E35
MSAKPPKVPEDPRIGHQSHALLRQALESTRGHVAAAADTAKAAMAESNPEVTRARRAARGDGPEELQAIVDAQRGHVRTIATTATAHGKAIDDLILDLAELFDS